MVFYVTAEGIIYDPLSDEAMETSNMDRNDKARERLTNRLADRRGKEEENGNDEQVADPVVAEDAEVPANNAAPVMSDSTALEIRSIEDRLRAAQLSSAAVAREKANNKYLSKQAAIASRKVSSSKAIPSIYVYKPGAADNSAKRAIVHHTGSHYHMAGSRQFQKGVRVKGVVSRHSVQGAKMQAARVANKNGLAAREDGRGQRSEGTQKGLGKQKKKSKKNKSTTTSSEK